MQLVYGNVDNCENCIMANHLLEKILVAKKVNNIFIINNRAIPLIQVIISRYMRY